MVLFLNEGISHIASAIGILLHMDKTTEQIKRINFASVCVEIESKDDMPHSVVVNIEDIAEVIIRVEYPWKPKRCLVRNKFRYCDKNCTKVRQVWRPVNKVFVGKTQLPINSTEVQDHVQQVGPITPTPVKHLREAKVGSVSKEPNQKIQGSVSQEKTNKFSVLFVVGNDVVYDKENLPPKRDRKVTAKAAEARQQGKEEECECGSHS